MKVVYIFFGVQLLPKSCVDEEKMYKSKNEIFPLNHVKSAVGWLLSVMYRHIIMQHDVPLLTTAFGELTHQTS